MNEIPVWLLIFVLFLVGCALVFVIFQVARIHGMIADLQRDMASVMVWKNVDTVLHKTGVKRLLEQLKNKSNQ